MKIVTDGKQFALRWGFWLFGYWYKDLTSYQDWWTGKCYKQFEGDCWGTKEKVLEVQKRLETERKHWVVKE